MKTPFAIALFVIMTIGSVFAQKNGNITGRIVDKQGFPLPGANVYIENMEKGTVTDMNGFFNLVNVAPGNYDVAVSYIGYQPVIESVNVESGKASSLTFEMEAGVDLAEVMVSSTLSGEVKALNTQKNNPNVTNIIAADQIGRFPDANVGDALKRIPGVIIQTDQGEARFGLIRGTEPRYNSVMINGERIPSAEAEIRSVQLDLIPADMVQSVELTKALTPDMDADAIGGSVNLITRTAPFKRRISATLGGGYNILAEKPIWTGSFVYGDRFAGNKLGLILSGSYHNHKLGSENIEAEWDYDDTNDNGQPDAGEEFINEFQNRQYYLQRIRRSVSLSLDYQLNESNTLFLTGMYNHRDDWENRYRHILTDIEEDAGAWEAELRRETKAGTSKNARLEDQRAYSIGLRGDHLFGIVKLDWNLNYAKASEERPQERYLSYRAKGIPITPNLSDPKKPRFTIEDPNYSDLNDGTFDDGGETVHYWELREITEEYQNTFDQDFSGRLDLKIPLAKGDFANTIKFGGRYRGKSKKRDNDFYEYEPTDEFGFNSSTLAGSNLVDQSKSNFLPGNYLLGNFVSEGYIGGLDLENGSNFDKEQILEELAGNFEASENVVAGYAMLSQQLGAKILAIAGIRMENTSLKYQGYIHEIEYDPIEDEVTGETLTQTEEVSKSYSNFLPGIHLKYSVTNNLILRAAWTNTLARPNYFDLVPYTVINQEDEELEVGNPELKPTTSMNLDLMAEYYFPSIGIISGGLFYKDITDFIVTSNSDVTGGVYDGWEISQPINGGNASIFGIEIALKKQLDFLPGFLSNIGIYGNYTYTASEIRGDLRIEGREGEKLPLPGSPKNSWNASLSYDGKKLYLRASLNYSGDYIEPDEMGDEAFFDRYYDKSLFLDLNGSYAITPYLRVFAEAKNLTNQPLRYYQGIPDRIMQEEFYNWRFTLGLKLDL